MLVHNMGSVSSSVPISSTSQVIPITTIMSPFAPAFYPPRDTVGSVIGMLHFLPLQ